MIGRGEFAIGSDVWPGTSKLTEELGELQQVLGKLIQIHGDAENHWSGNLREKLVEETGDVIAAIAYFTVKNLTPEERTAIELRAAEKVSLFEQWHQEDPKLHKTIA